MQIEASVELICDNCNRTGIASGIGNKKAAIRYFKEIGWHFIDDSAFCCEECKNDFEDAGPVEPPTGREEPEDAKK